MTSATLARNRQEMSLELSRTVAHLAAANEQLAAAHNISIGHLNRLLSAPAATCTKCKAHSPVATNKHARRWRKPVIKKTSKIEMDLRREIQDLTSRNDESRATNERLANDLEKQRLLTERLTRDIEEMSTRAERREPSSSASSESVEELKSQLVLKREARQRAIANISSEMDRLRRELESEKSAHEQTRKMLEELQQARSTTEQLVDVNCGCNASERLEASRLADLLKTSEQAMSELWLQVERTDDLRFQLESGPDTEERLARSVNSLKRLSEETRASLELRNQQVNLLKDRLAQLVVRLAEPCDEPWGELREELERQGADVTRSRQLSDERARILAELREHSFRQLHDLRLKLDNCRKENQSLDEELSRSQDKMDGQATDILNLESQLGLAKADCRDLQNQMSLINGLFSQMLLGASSAQMDLDRLTRLLQENHDLISGIAKENGTEAAALPKLLLDIIGQVDAVGADESADNEKLQELEQQGQSIADNLPKVWRVLLELLSCHAAGEQVIEEPTPDSCYKSVDTPKGPRLVISVSKTYIRLKELILEKKHLEKEMNRMKQLNSHLEGKLSQQEKRLSTVSDELSETWNVVSRMQAQHQQLHTHEKILRYELQQKRKMLQELKQELEYCREKWESARQKNTNTEIEWRSLRREFAARKAAATHIDSFNNSAESGFSDEREDEEEDDDSDEEVQSTRVRINPRRRPTRKDGSRPLTVPDTESEQPTDTELSEPKTASCSTSGQRSPSPDTEPELDNCEMAAATEETSEGLAENNCVSQADSPSSSEMLDPLDKALTNVIQNLIATNEPEYADDSRDNSQQTIAQQPAPIVSVFSIGPIPADRSNLPVKNVQFGNPLVIGPSSDSPSAAKEEKQVNDRAVASTSSTVQSSTEHESRLDARAERLRNLEAQAKWLVKKVSDTNRRGSALNSRLEELHETYGSTPVAPPMPDVLPAFRLQTQLEEERSENDNDSAAAEPK